VVRTTTPIWPSFRGFLKLLQTSPLNLDKRTQASWLSPAFKLGGKPESLTSDSLNGSWSRKIPRLVAETVSADTKNGNAARRASDAPVSNPYLAGEVIGDRYRLVSEIGRGGMGVVWVAHSLVLGVDVALKMIRASATGSAVASRMAREAHAAARMGHPALVRVFDFGWTSRGDPYLVMELVQGETLFTMLNREQRINPIRAVQMLLPIADGLRLAHDKHIIHRDIKPDNILLATDALGRVQPKLFDFGIAKVEPNAHDGKLTQVGAVLGSPEYMSPEQALGSDDVDGRTDVWSLAIVLYELVTGVVPFSKSNYNALMQAIIHDEPTPMPEDTAGDASLWQIIERGLAKRPSQRWSDMTEFGEALALWLYERGIKEDLSGNSIRAVWLDRVTGLAQLDTAASLPPSRKQTGASSSLSSRTTQSLATASNTLRAKKQRQLLIVALVLGIGIGGLIVTLSLRGHASAADSTPSSRPPGKATASAPAASVAISVPATSESTRELPTPGSVSEPPLATPVNASTKRIMAKPQQLPRTVGKTQKRSHDFGF